MVFGFFVLLTLSCNVVEMCLKFMIQVEDDEEWSIADDVVEDEDSSRLLLRSYCNVTVSSISIAGETGLDRLAVALGGKTLLPHIIRLLPTMLTSSTK